MSSHDNRSSASRGSRRAGHDGSPLTNEWHRTRGEVPSGGGDADFSVVRDGNGSVYRRPAPSPSTVPYPRPRSDAAAAPPPHREARRDLRREAMGRSMAAANDRYMQHPPPPVCPPMYYQGPLPAGYVGPAPPGLTNLPRDIPIRPRGYVDPTPTPDRQGMEMFSVRDSHPEATEFLRNKDMFQPTVNYAGDLYPRLVNVTNNYTNNNSINYYFPNDPKKKTPEEFGRDIVKEARDKAEKTMEGYAKYFANAEFDRRLETERRAAEDAKASATFSSSSSSVRRGQEHTSSHRGSTGMHDADAMRFAADTGFQSQHLPARPDRSQVHGQSSPRVSSSQAGYGSPHMSASQVSYRSNRYAPPVAAHPAPILAGSYMNTRAWARSNPPEMGYSGTSRSHFDKPVGPGSSASQVPTRLDSRDPGRPLQSSGVSAVESNKKLLEWREDVASNSGSYRGSTTHRSNGSRRG